MVEVSVSSGGAGDEDVGEDVDKSSSSSMEASVNKTGNCQDTSTISLKSKELARGFFRKKKTR